MTVKFSFADPHFTSRGKARDRIVMRSVPTSFGFLADALLAMNNRRFLRHEMQFAGGVGGLCREIERAVGIQFHAPGIYPRETIVRAESRFPEAAATHFGLSEEFFSCRVGYGEVGEFQIIDHKARSSRTLGRRLAGFLVEKMSARSRSDVRGYSLGYPV